MKRVLFFVCFSQYCLAQNFDINTLRQTNLNRNKNFDNFFCTYSDMVGVSTVGMPLALYTVGAFKKNKQIQRIGINMAISAGINGVFTLVAKQLVNRPRPAVSYPFLNPLENVTHYSFPSGHTSASFNTATALCIAYPKWQIIAPSFAYAGLMAYSRMHIGVHYPSDVFAGALLGTGSAFLSNFITKKLQKNSATRKYYNSLLF